MTANSEGENQYLTETLSCIGHTSPVDTSMALMSSHTDRTSMTKIKIQELFCFVVDRLLSCSNFIAFVLGSWSNEIYYIFSWNLLFWFSLVNGETRRETPFGLCLQSESGDLPAA